uniref:Tetratricopeptide repeat protein 29 n=1 Tax=Sinocyclocheilus grahami TaxID=75366 RepID=A0A672QQK2_SINGR
MDEGESRPSSRRDNADPHRVRAHLWMYTVSGCKHIDVSVVMLTVLCLWRSAEPLRQRVCVALLREGCPRAFAQMFSLLQRWDAADPHALRTLQQRLASAETAETHGNEAYDNHMFLARFFTEPEDKWLKHHFIQLALHSARKFKMDSGKREAEANLHMGQVYLEKGQLERAQEHYEVFYHLTMGRTWQDPSGRMHHSRSCEELQKLFTLLGQRLLQAQDYTHAIKMFNEAYQMAKESGDRGSEGEAAYRLGLAYQSTGDQKTAKQVCSERSQTLLVHSVIICFLMFLLLVPVFQRMYGDLHNT